MLTSMAWEVTVTYYHVACPYCGDEGQLAPKGKDEKWLDGCTVLCSHCCEEYIALLFTAGK
jgi:hypothetical protein